MIPTIKKKGRCLKMPNWATGNLKIRGKIDDILKFLNECLDYTGTDERNEESPEPIILTVDIEDHFIELNERYSMFYLKHTHRGFIESHYTPIETDDKTGESIVCFGYREAWGVDEDKLQNLSQKYNVDFKIVSVEPGMRLCQDIEIIRGEIVRAKEYTYDNWMWECPYPLADG